VTGDGQARICERLGAKFPGAYSATGNGTALRRQHPLSSSTLQPSYAGFLELNREVRGKCYRVIQHQPGIPGPGSPTIECCRVGRSPQVKCQNRDVCPPVLKITRWVLIGSENPLLYSIL